MRSLPTSAGVREVAIPLVLAMGIAGLLSGVGFVASDYLSHRKEGEARLTEIGTSLAATLAAPLAKENGEGAHELLRSLGDKQGILMASVWLRRGGKPIATWVRAGVAEMPVPDQTASGFHRESSSLWLLRPVFFEGEAVGTLVVRLDTTDISPLLERDLSIGAMFLMTSLLMAGLLFRRMKTETPGKTPRTETTAPGPALSSREVIVVPDGGQGSVPAVSGVRTDDTSVEPPPEALKMQHKDWDAEVSMYKRELEEEVTRHALAEEQAQAVLAAEVERAGERATSRAEFLAGMSHVFRTRINGFIGTAWLALEGNLSGEQKQSLEAASGTAEDVLRTFEDLVDFLRLEAGSVTLVREEFGITETLYDVTRMFTNAANSKGISLELDVHPEIPAAVTADRARFRQVMETLVGNAVRATASGRVTIEAIPLFRTEKTTGIHFVVRDSGPGMTREQFTRALEPLAQPWDPERQPDHGSGLSLAIANHLAGLMGGNFWLKTEGTAGNEFHFSATFEFNNRSEESAPDKASLFGVRVLIADRNELTRRALHHILARWHMKPALATTGKEAVEMLRSAAASGHSFDLALIDIEMCGSDGKDLASDVRQRPELGNPTVFDLIALDEGPVTDLPHRFRSPGYLVKPVAQPVLLKALSEAVRNLRGA